MQYPYTKENARNGGNNRWSGEFATEPWGVDPLDMMSGPEFLSHLTALYGPLYLEAVDYERTADGRLLPAHTCEGRIRSLLRRHPEGLTRLAVRRPLGMGYGVVQRIVKPPAYVVVGTAKGDRGYADLWALAVQRHQQ